MNIDEIFRNYSTGLEKEYVWKKYQNMSPPPGAAPAAQKFVRYGTKCEKLVFFGEFFKFSVKAKK